MAPSLDLMTTQAEALADEALRLIEAGRADEAVATARKATGLSKEAARPWAVLGRALAATGELDAGYGAYECSAGLTGGPPAPVAGEAGLLALRIGRSDDAERLLTRHLGSCPPTAETVAALAEAQTAVGAFDRAHATLKRGLEAAPAAPLLWLALGRLLCAEGRHPHAVVFLEEALRLDPTSSAARDRLADALLASGGGVERALALGEEAAILATADEVAPLRAAHGRRLLAAGHPAEGWSALAHEDAREVDFRIAAPPWLGGPLPAGRLLLAGEPDVGDEVLLAGAARGVIAGGPPVLLALDPCWIGLAQRSFPDAKVVPLISRLKDGRLQQAPKLDTPHLHEGEFVAAWAPMRALPALSPDAAGGPADPQPWLKPDEGRVLHWRGMLETLGPGRKVGVLWRPPVEGAEARWQAPPPDALAAPLSTPGLRLVAVQDEAVEGELAWIRDVHGLQINLPPGLDFADLDHLAGLMCALDVVVGPPCAATFAAAGCGVETWILAPGRHWAQLGTTRFPWFPRARVFTVAQPNAWDGAMAELQAALEGFAAASPEG